MFAFLKWLFGTSQDRTIRRYEKIVDTINQEEQKLQSLSDEELRRKQTFLERDMLKVKVLKHCFRKHMPLSKMPAVAYVVPMCMCRAIIKSGI